MLVVIHRITQLLESLTVDTIVISELVLVIFLGTLLTGLHFFL